MAHVQRSDVERGGDPLPRVAADYGYDAGGHIAQLQADLAQRLLSQGVAPASALTLALAPDLTMPPGERAVRFLSVAGGYGALLAGYVAAAMAIAHWV